MNTGMQRATSLVITKSVGGVVIYTRTYSLLSAFSTFAAITSSVCASLSVSDYTSRLNSFKAYVESNEVGLTVDITAAYVQNTTSCPIGA